MDDPRLLPPIPTPAAQRWREVRLIYLPRAIFVLGVIVAAVLWTQWVSPPTMVAEASVDQNDVRSPQSGVITSLNVSARQIVKAGDVLGEMSPARPLAADATAGGAARPATFTAPIDGMVTQIVRRVGDPILAGQTVLRINPSRPDRLIGYLRQPLPFEPKPGMVAEVRTRAAPRQTAVTTIMQVGSTMEPIPSTLVAAMRLPSNPPPEPALRIDLKLPAGLKVRPGEHVDVIIH